MNDKTKENPTASIQELRQEIDCIDEKIALLIKERFNLVNKIGAIKKAKGLSVTDLNREQTVIDNVCNKFECDKEKLAAKTIYASIIRTCSELQK